MKPKIKICGMHDPDNIREVAGVLPDYLGFIFYPPSPRYVGENFTIPEDLPSSINRVGVFVNETAKHILDKTILHNLRYVQLHGNESVELCAEVRSTGIKVIKVFSVGEEFDFSVTTPYKDDVDYFMFDAKGLLFGGNAQPFNWKILESYDQDVPFFLSGGISPENVANISQLKNMNLHAIDINSGVEQQPGVKDVNKITKLVRNLKSKI